MLDVTLHMRLVGLACLGEHRFRGLRYKIGTGYTVVQVGMVSFLFCSSMSPLRTYYSSSVVFESNDFSSE